MNRWIALTAIAIVFASCKTQSVVTKTIEAPPPKMDASAAIIDSIRKHQFQFEWLSAKAKVSVNNADDQTDFTANIRMRKDSAIWISVSPALGVEVARMLMTQDSIRIIDRLKKDRYTKSYHFFNAYTSLPVDFNTMQNLIIGNVLFLKDHYDVAMKDSIMALTEHHSVTGDSLLINRNYTPVFQMITDTASSVSSTNAQFDIQYNPPFSLWRKIVIRYKTEMTVEITFSKVKLNEPMKFPFKD